MGHGGEIGGQQCRQGGGRHASLILTTLIRNPRPLAEVMGFRRFVFGDGAGPMLREEFIICKRVSCFHTL